MRQDGLTTVYIAVIVGVGAGIVLTTALAIGFYLKMRRNRDRKFKEAIVNKLVKEQQERHNNNKYLQVSNTTKETKHFQITTIKSNLDFFH